MLLPHKRLESLVLGLCRSWWTHEDMPGWIAAERLLLLLLFLLGELRQDINAWKTQRRDHTAIACYNKLNIEERNSERSDERDGDYYRKRGSASYIVRE